MSKPTVEFVDIADELPSMCAYCEEYIDRAEDYGGWWSEPIGDGRYGVLKMRHKWCWEGFIDAVHDTYDDEGVRIFWESYARGDSAARRRQAVALRSTL